METISDIKNAKILIVDDEVRDRNFTEFMCKDLGYEVIVASGGREALKLVSQEMPDLIIMDVMMPDMDGFEATEKLKSNDHTKQIPVILLTSLGERDYLKAGIRIGASDYITKPFDTEELSIRIRNNLIVKKYLDLIKDHNVQLEKDVAERTEKLKEAYDTIKNSYIETIQKLNVAAEYRDEETGSHIKRMSLYSKELAFALGLNDGFVETIYYASPMHDIGKVGIPDNILLKGGDLSSDEWEVMKSHTTIGAKILGESKSPFLKMAKEIALTHHEKWNGTGYPNGLSGNEIPLSGRIVNIVDQYDALRSKRPYKNSIDHNVVIEIITKGRDRTTPGDFDPEVLNVFKKVAKKFKEIHDAKPEE